MYTYNILHYYRVQCVPGRHVLLPETGETAARRIPFYIHDDTNYVSYIIVYYHNKMRGKN